MRRHHILIPLAALLATLPLILHGCSCGHDFDFHLQSWLDAAAQMRHGTLYPRWAFTPAFNAGEPRFVFYPPLSWLLGAALSLIFPFAAIPAIYTWIALTAAGFAMHHLARFYASPNATLIASILYLANPYMLFNAFERTAYAELLAAVWIPLLLLGAIRRRPTIHGIAITLALLWLTNAPAAVMGSYTFALLAIIRVLTAFLTQNRHPERSIRAFANAQSKDPETVSITQTAGPLPTTPPLKLATTYILGTLLGLTLPAFYLIPAAYERRYVQIAMAVIPNMRIQDNFLFGHTADAPHNAVLHTASLLAVTLLAATATTLLALYIKSKHQTAQHKRSVILSDHSIAQHKTPVILSEASGNFEAQSKDPDTLLSTQTAHSFSTSTVFLSLAALTVLIAFLLTPASLPLWIHLPELAFLQFSWRLLTILSAVLCFALALFFTRANSERRQSFLTIPWTRGSCRALPFSLVASWSVLLLPLALTTLCIHLYRQPCAYADAPTGTAQSFNSGHGVPPTDEYTPTAADNDSIRPNEPAYWLSTNPNAYAPNTTPNPGSTDPNFDGSFPANQTLSTPPPHHFTIHIDKPEYLILNLRDYPNWRVSLGCKTCRFYRILPHQQRDDGLLALPFETSGDYTIDIAWDTTIDKQLGYVVTLLALIALAFTLYRQRSSGAPSSPQPYRG